MSVIGALMWGGMARLLAFVVESASVEAAGPRGKSVSGDPGHPGQTWSRAAGFVDCHTTEDPTGELSSPRLLQGAVICPASPDPLGCVFFRPRRWLARAAWGRRKPVDCSGRAGVPEVADRVRLVALTE